MLQKGPCKKEKKKKRKGPCRQQFFCTSGPVSVASMRWELEGYRKIYSTSFIYPVVGPVELAVSLSSCGHLRFLFFSFFFFFCN
jgi:hypothetical protein